eukprot:5760801-Pleurochrysis_carterae.AAC.2
MRCAQCASGTHAREPHLSTCRRERARAYEGVVAQTFTHACMHSRVSHYADALGVCSFSFSSLQRRQT